MLIARILIVQDLNVGVKEVKIFTNGSLAWEGMIDKVLYLFIYLFIYLQICVRICQQETSNSAHEVPTKAICLLWNLFIS